MNEAELHDLLKNDPERAWPLVREFVHRHPGSATAQDFIEDLVYEHDLSFIPRIESAALDDPIFREVVVQCHVGGMATAGVEAFRHLQGRLSIEGQRSG